MSIINPLDDMPLLEIIKNPPREYFELSGEDMLPRGEKIKPTSGCAKYRIPDSNADGGYRNVYIYQAAYYKYRADCGSSQKKWSAFLSLLLCFLQITVMATSSKFSTIKWIEFFEVGLLFSSIVLAFSAIRRMQAPQLLTIYEYHTGIHNYRRSLIWAILFSATSLIAMLICCILNQAALCAPEMFSITSETVAFLIASYLCIWERRLCPVKIENNSECPPDAILITDSSSRI